MLRNACTDKISMFVQLQEKTAAIPEDLRPYQNGAWNIKRGEFKGHSGPLVPRRA